MIPRLFLFRAGPRLSKTTKICRRCGLEHRQGLAIESGSKLTPATIMRLQDQVILITGSTTGIGEFMARRFIKEGAKVILHGRDAARGEALRKELGEDKAAFCQGSLEDPTYPEKLAADAAAAFGKVDSLVNNAALTIRGRISETDATFFDRMMAVNARAPMLLIRARLWPSS